MFILRQGDLELLVLLPFLPSIEAKLVFLSFILRFIVYVT